MKKWSKWFILLSAVFFLGAMSAAIPLYRMALKNQPPIVIQSGEDSSPPKEHSCSLGVVEWQDAAIWTKAGGTNLNGDWHNLLGHEISIGCVSVRDNVLVVVHEFSDGKPDTYLALPAAWVYHVQWLKGVK